MATAATRKVKFYIELVTGMPASVEFELGDVIEFEGEPLVVRAVERADAYSGHPDALAAELVVRLTKDSGRFEKLRRPVDEAWAAEVAAGTADIAARNRGVRTAEREDVSQEGAA
jgi:hypothetical protein